MASQRVTGSIHKHSSEDRLPLHLQSKGQEAPLNMDSKQGLERRFLTLSRFPKCQDKRGIFSCLLMKQTGIITVTPQPKKRHTLVGD